MSSDLYSTSFSSIGLIAFFISMAVIVLFWISSFFSFILKREIVVKQQKILIAGFAVSLAIWALLWDPAPYYDSYRHFQWLDQIRSQIHEQNLSLWRFLRDGFKGSTVGNYKSLIAFNVIRYFVTKISNNNHLLPFVCTLLDYYLICYIVTDYFESRKIKFNWLFPYTSICFSFIPYFMVVSGIRNALAAAITAFGIYRKIYKKKGNVEYFLITIIVATIHPNMLLPLVIGLIYPFCKGMKSIFILFGGVVFLRFGVNYLQRSSLSFISYLGNTISYYMNEGKYSGEMLNFTVDIVVIVSILIIIFLNRSSISKINTDGLQFCIVYMFVILATAFLGGTNFLTRSGYALGPFAVFIIEPLYQLKYSLAAPNGLANCFLMLITISACLINIVQGYWILLAQFF